MVGVDPEVYGDVDISAVGELVADPGRCRVLLALGDGRALAAGVLAAEAGVAPSTASAHLAKLTAAGLLRVERHGRHRYYRLTSARVGELLEVMMRLAPPRPVRSLREGSRAAALRAARTCYDHLAGRLGVEIMAAMLAAGRLTGGDGTYDPATAYGDRPSAYGSDIDYTLTDSGRAFLDDLGVRLPPRRTAVRYCVDWSEQRHHLAGGVGRGLLDRLTTLAWIRRHPANRAVQVTDAGRAGLARHFAVTWPATGAE